MAYDTSNITKSRKRSHKRHKASGDRGVEVKQFRQMLRMTKQDPVNRRNAARDYMLLVVMGNMGLRIGEAVLLQREDFRGLLAAVPRAEVIALKKRDPESTKTIYVHPKIAAAIQRYIKKEMYANQQLLFPGGSETEFYNGEEFEFAIEGHISARMVRYMFQSYVSALDFPEKYTPHCLRVMYGTHCWEKTQDSAFVRDQLGHSAIDGLGVTNQYITLSQKRAKELIKKTGYFL